MPDGKFREVAEVSEIIKALTTLRYQSVQYCFPAATPDGRPLRGNLGAHFDGRQPRG